MSEPPKDPTDDRVLVTVTGPDRTGVTSTLTGILAEEGATLFDIEQVVVQGQLTLCLLVGFAGTRDVLKEMLFAAKELGMDLDFKPVRKSAPEWTAKFAEPQKFVITAIGRSLGAAVFCRGDGHGWGPSRPARRSSSRPSSKQRSGDSPWRAPCAAHAAPMSPSPRSADSTRAIRSWPGA